VGLVGVVLGSAALAIASPIVIVDGNSTVRVDTSSDVGMFSWEVDGVQHIARQWFWYRVGDTGPEYAVNTLGAPIINLTDGDADGSADTLYMKYTGSGLRIEITYVLTGGAAGSMVSDIIENIRVTNISGTSQAVRFFQYSDFNLNNTADNDWVDISGGNTATQTDIGGITVGETVVTPKPTYVEACDALTLLGKLNDSQATTLTGQTVASGDVAWAFQWNATLGNNKSLLISKDKQIVPEPATLVMLALGVGAAMLRRYRRAS
jgi:hypothetical protein